MELGVQTHFSQGWSPSLLGKLAALGVTEIRDEQEWNKVEKTAGAYTFTPTLTNYMDRAESLGVDAMLVFTSANTLYDGGLTPYTQAGRQAYANYIVAVLQKYGSQVQEIEIWNEFNNAAAFTGPAATNDAYYYAELLKTVWNTVKPLFPDVKVLGGSVNVIGVGALESVFKLGALNFMDGVVVHPYRATAEHVDDELTHLQDVMARYGAVKPIYATEFGSEFDNPADVPDFMLKMVTLMASVHVEEAYWYALIDETYYKNMGLYTIKGEEKPAAAAFTFIQKELLVHGDPVRVDTGDDLTLVYRFGADTYVMWSAGRDVAFSGGGTYFDAMGRVIAAPTTLTMTPIVMKGASFTLSENTVVADTLMQFNEGDWQYFAKSKSGALTQLSLTDWDWTSYLGSKYTAPLQVSAGSVTPSGTGANPVSVVERFTSDRDQTLLIKGDWTTRTTGDGIDLHILINGREVFTKIFHGNFSLSSFEVALKTGDKLDFVLGPNQTFGGDDTQRHITITRAPAAKDTLTVHELPSGFDPLLYTASNVDLARVFGNDTAKATQHYTQFGISEGRAISGFDPLIYAASHIDLARWLGVDAAGALNHYLTYGADEGRATSGFDPLIYAASHVDLARWLGVDAAGALKHYLTYGADEGRATSGFDPLIYAASHVDLARWLGVDAAGALKHYLTYGADEGRATSGFDPLIYAASDVDLARWLGVDAAGALNHYLTYGADEGRATSGFDSAAYLLSNADLAGRTARQALDHWLAYGADEGRLGDALFGREQTSHVLTGTSTSGSINWAGDRDWFQVHLAAGQSLWATLGTNNSTLSSGTIEIYNNLGQNLALNNANDPHQLGALGFTSSTNDNYYVVVRGSGSETGQYQIKINNDTLPQTVIKSFGHEQLYSVEENVALGITSDPGVHSEHYQSRPSDYHEALFANPPAVDAWQPTFVNDGWLF